MDRRLYAMSLIGWGLGVVGCGALPPARPNGSPPDLAALSAQVATAPTSMRGQKPEPKRNLLDIRPEDPGRSEDRGARVRALVNGQAILEEEVQASAMQSMGSVRNDAEKAELLNAKLNELIDRELVLQDAESRLSGKKGGNLLAELRAVATKEFEKQWLQKLMRANNHTDEKEFKKFLRANGMPVETMQRQWERNFIAMEYVRGRLEPTMNRISQREVLAYYEAHAEEYKVEEGVDWQDLFVATAKHPSREAARQFAQSLVTRARKGEDFAKLVKTFDNGDSSLRPDGAGIGTKRGEIRPLEAEPLVLSLKEGEVGGPIEMESGFHLVRVSKRTMAGRKEFDAAMQRQIRDKLRGDAFVKEMKRFVLSLRRQAVIEVAEHIK